MVVQALDLDIYTMNMKPLEDPAYYDWKYRTIMATTEGPCELQAPLKFASFTLLMVELPCYCVDGLIVLSRGMTDAARLQ